MRRILVTGATGLFGGTLTAYLSERGHTVIASKRGQSSRPILAKHTIKCDLSNAAAVDHLSTMTFDTVVHSAARIRGTNPKEFKQDNVDATANVLAAAKRQNCRTFIYISTIGVYDGEGPFSEYATTRAKDFYAKTKLAGEQLVETACRVSTMKGVTLRFAGLHGHARKGGVVNHFMKYARKGQTLNIIEPNSVLRLLFLKDAVHAIDRILASDKLPNYDCFNIASEDIFTTQELAELVLLVTGSQSSFVQTSAGTLHNKVVCIERARSELGFTPIGIEDHIRELSKVWQT